MEISDSIEFIVAGTGRSKTTFTQERKEKKNKRVFKKKKTIHIIYKVKSNLFTHYVVIEIRNIAFEVSNKKYVGILVVLIVNK